MARARGLILCRGVVVEARPDSCKTDVTMKIGFIGAGKMAQALADGFVAAGSVKVKDIWASAPSNTNLRAMKEKGYRVTHENAEVVRSCTIVILAVKPHFSKEVLEGIQSFIRPEEQIIISVMTGITLETLENLLGPNQGIKLFRVMPNTTVMVGRGASVFARNQYVQPLDYMSVESLFASVGLWEEVPERVMNACTGLSGSGPAYVYSMIQAMSDGAVKMGLPRQTATRLAAQTFAGAAAMVLETGKHPTVLQDEVTSPGGTTIHGLHQLEVGGVRGAIMNAVEAATRRADELAKT